jgi:hypothetical protein
MPSCVRVCACPCVSVCVCTLSCAQQDGRKSGVETDVDCGGAACAAGCTVGQSCAVNGVDNSNNCAAGLSCSGGVCVDQCTNRTCLCQTRVRAFVV